MVLFYINHLGALSNITTLRATKFKNEKCVLIHPEKSESDILQELERKDFFQKVIPVKSKGETELWKDGEFPIESIEHILKEEDLCLESFDEILISGELIDWFMAYCELKKIMYSQILIGNQGLYEILRVNHNRSDYKGYVVRLCYPENSKKSVRNKVYSEIVPKFSACDCEIVNFQDQFFEVDERDKNILFEIFDLHISENENLILPLSRWCLWQHMEVEGLVEIDKNRLFGDNIVKYAFLSQVLLADFFFSDKKITIKPHPNTTSKLIKRVFPDEKILNPVVPIEYTLYNENVKFKKVLSTSESTTDKIDSFVDEIIDITKEALKNYYLFIKAYVALSMMKSMLNKSEIYYLGLPVEFGRMFIKNMTDFQSFFELREEACNFESRNYSEIVIVYELESEKSEWFLEYLRNSPDNIIFVFMEISMFNDYPMFQQEFFLENIIFKTIEKKLINEKSLCNLVDEVFCFYCKDKKLRNKIAEFTFEKTLKRTGVLLNVPSVSEDENVKESQNWKELMKKKKIPSEKMKYAIRPVEVLPDCYQDKKIVIWGTGIFGKQMLRLFRFYKEVVPIFVDNNPDKWGTEFEGYPIISPEELVEMNKHTEIVLQLALKEEFEEQVKAQVAELGIGNVIPVNEALDFFGV